VFTRTALCCSVLAYIASVAVTVINEQYNPVFGRAWLEAFIPFLQTAMILTLTRDGGRSKMGSWLRSKPMTKLGEISMSFCKHAFSTCVHMGR